MAVEIKELIVKGFVDGEKKIQEKDIVKIISKELDIKIIINVDKKRIRKFDRPHQTGSNNKLKKLTGYKSTYKLKDSIKRIIEHSMKGTK